ncbi:DUF624 domain-containing protein [Gleimia hominis]|uniref:DUF624 domain-containing protein n=1 Tax=Gleimia hominis TaxID=595468 RepID=UPI000C804EE8|nr:DUF624 domain-containing protein [Gleimia hominis]WIK64314.1 DUF624 domain-containing protein [Gleimia hominis]
MPKWLSPSSSFYAVLSLAADLVVVNLLMVLCSLPVITIGATTRAANAVIADLIKGGGARPARQFLREFTYRFGAATGGAVLCGALAMLGGYNWLLIGQASSAITSTSGMVLEMGLIAGTIVVAGITLWLFALLGQLSKPFRTPSPKPTTPSFVSVLQTATIRSIRYLPRTAAAVLVWAAPIILALVVPGARGTVLFTYFVFTFAFCWFLTQLIFSPHLQNL